MVGGGPESVENSIFSTANGDHHESHGGLMFSIQVRQSEGLGFKSRSGQIAYFHGVKTRLSTLGTGDVPRGSDST